jgi:16S rRNA A1518/A1519 N6-dimethyltransferase RsmA/KsgA/DIM1 with predicted DNA glycosylase/AP lyase activity
MPSRPVFSGSRSEHLLQAEQRIDPSVQQPAAVARIVAALPYQISDGFVCHILCDRLV